MAHKSGVKVVGRRVIASMLVVSTGVALAMPLQHGVAFAAPNPVTQQLADGLESLETVIAGASELEELAEAVPFTGIALALSDGVDVLESLASTLGALNDVGSTFVEQAPGDVEDELEGLDTTIDGVTVTFGCDATCDPGETAVDVAEAAGVVSITLPISLSRSIVTPLVFESSVLDIGGGDLTVNLTAATTLQLTFDTATVALAVAPFAVAFSAALTGGPITADTRFGVADATATLADLNVTLGLTVPFTDPDGVSGITVEEWENTTVGDLATVSRTGSVAGNISFDTDLIAGSPDAGPIDIGDGNLADGYSFTLPSLDDLDPFSLISPEALIAAIGQAAAALGGGQAATDIDIPFLDGTVRQLAQASRPILDVVDSLGVICGTENGATPAGSVEDLAGGTKVYCQGVVSTGVKAGLIAWTSAVASEDANTSGAAADGTLALGATKNAEFTMDLAGGDFTVSVTYTATFDDDNDGTIDREVPNRTSQQPPRSVQELIAAVDQLGNFDLDPAQILAYDETTKALTFSLKKTFDPDPVALPLAIGDQLEAATGIVGLQSTDGGITADASAIVIDITPGVLLLPPDEWDTISGPDGCPDPSNPDPCTSALDLFFVKVNASGPEFAVGDATFTLDAPKLVGQLGYLGISADVGTLNIEKANDADPVLAVNLTPAGPMTIGGVPFPDAIRLRELLFEISNRATVSGLNLKLDGALTVQASLNGTEIGTAGLTVVWDPVLVGTPVINADASLAGFFANFNPVPNLFGTHTGANDTTVLDASGASFSATAVGARIENITDGSSCEVASVTAMTLTCSDPLAGGAENDWDTGDLYRLRVGSPLAMLEVLLDNLDQIIAAIDNVSGGGLGDALDTKLPLVGVSPRELLAQLQDLRRTIEEIRGTGASVRCGTGDVTPTPSGDASKLTIPAGGSATIFCNAYNPKGADSASWGTPTVLETPDITAAVTANATNVATAGTAPTQNAAITFTNTGGSTVELFQRSQRVNDDGTTSTIGYQIPVMFTDVDGEHSEEYPSLAQPTTIQALEDAIKDKLGISEGFDLDFDDTSVPGANLVTLDVGIGRCNADALCAGAANMPPLSTPINASVAGLGDLVSASSAGDVSASYNADVHLKLGFDLDETPEVYVMPGTGIDLQGRFAGDGLDFQASLGPVTIAAGVSARTASDGGTPDDPSDDTPAGIGVMELGADLSVGDAITAPVTVGNFLSDLGTHLAPTFSAADDTDCGSITLNDGGTPGDPSDDPVEEVGGAGVLGCAVMSVGLIVGGPPASYAGDLGLKVELNAGEFAITPVIPDNLLATLLAQALDLRLLLKALPEIIGTVEAGLRATAASAAGNGKLPLIGDALDAGADIAGKLRETAQAIVDAIPAEVLNAANANTALVAALQQFIFTQLGGTGLLLTGNGEVVDDATDIVVLTDCGGGYGSCDDTNTLADLQDVRAIFAIGQVDDTTVPFDLGLDGVPLRLVGSVAPHVEWYFVVDLGLNKTTGPYIGVADPGAPGGPVRSDQELTLGAGIGLGENAAACEAVIPDPVAPLDELITGDYTGDRCLGGQLAFLGVQIRDSNDNPSHVGLEVGLDLTNDSETTLGLNNAGNVNLEPTIGLDANVDVRFRTGIAGGQVAGFPEVVGTFAFSWGWTLGDSVAAPTVGFDNIHLNLKPLLDKFLTPITSEVQRITGPFKPVIDTLTAPIPVVSDLAALVGQPPVTLLSLMEAISGNDLSLIQTIAAFITFINDSPLGDGYYPLNGASGGSFGINSAGARKAQGPTDAAKLVENGIASASSLLGLDTVQGDGAAVKAKAASATPATKANLPGTFGVPGLTFPFLDNPSQIFGLLMGQDITLVRFDVGPLQASAGFQYNFPPILIGPVPIGIGVGGSVTVKGRFVIGYDTSGLRKVLNGGSGVFLFDGIFLDDLDINGVDVPEISFIGEVYAQAGVTIGIASAGIVAGLRITVDLNLDDSPEPDGKLRIEEIFNKLQNPICLFEISGKLEAFIKAFVEISLFIASIRFEFTILELELLNFSGKCDPPKPQLAELDGSGNLTLNIGPRNGLRNVAEDTTAEEVTVRPVDNAGTYSVSAFGVYQTYGPNGEFNGPAVVKVIGDGAGDDDKLQMLPGGDQESVPKNPAAGNPVEPASIPFTAALELIGGDNNDIILGGDANDTLSGGNGDDRVEGGKGDDTLNGDAGIDTLNGDEGDDDMFGGTEGDKLQGGPGNDEAYGGPGIDLIQGGPGTGSGSGATDGNDILVGDEDPDSIEGGSGDDLVYGDHFLASAEIDSVCDATDVSYDPADPAEAADKLTGGPGTDLLVGGAGPDEIFGGGGNDRLCGNQGDDIMDGDQGSDLPAPSAPAAEQPGDDVVRGGAGSDKATGNLGNDFVHGGLHRDQVDGAAGNDDVAGGGGRDFVLGGVGLDILVGDSADIDQGVANNKAARAVPIATSLVINIGTGTGGTADCAFVVDAADTANADCIQGGDDADLIFGEGGNDQVFAGSGNDVVFAGEGDDNPVRGESGNDTMSGEDGVDTMYGDSGADVMYGNANDDTMRGGIDDDYMEGNGALDTMFGEAAQDDILGGTSEDGAADDGDVIDGGAAPDVIVGDNGEITRPGGNDPDDATSVLRNVTLYDVGDPRVGGGDTIDGDLANDQIWGGNAGDGITGEQGIDRIEGNEGIDTVNGGTGNDRVVGGSSSRAMLLGPDGVTPVAYDQAPDAGDFLHGDDADDVITGDNATLAFDGVATMTGFDSAGSHGDDEISGNNGQDRLYGQLGGDTITGDANEDYAIGDLGAITPGSPTGTWPGGAPKHEVRLEITPDNGGVDDIDGGGADDHLFGVAAGDVMRGQLGDDYMEGNGGQDSMYGLAPDVDILLTGTDEDDMIGGSSRWTRPGDIVRLDVGETVMQGNPDHDVMTGDNADIARITNGAGTEWAPDEVIPDARKRTVTLLDREKVAAALAAVSGGDFMVGNNGSDRMFGEGGPDTVKGNGNDDLLEGNQGSDWLEGNNGEDDIVGGGSFLASVGGNFPAGSAADLGDPDETDAIFGGAGGDVVAGDNAAVIRRTAGNTAVYNAALSTAYFTTDHEDAVPGWWLGVTTDRLVTLRDRTTLNTARFGSDLVSAGTGQDVAFGQDGNDWVSGGTDDDTTEGNGGADFVFGDRAPAVDGLNGEPIIPAPVAPGSGLVDRDGAVTPDGEDDITGGSNVSHRDGVDTVGGDGEDDFVLGDNGTLQRNIATSAYVRYPGDGGHDRIMRRAIRLDVAAPAASAVWGADILRGNRGDDALWGQDGNDSSYGEAGDDDLFGELGNDSMFGGTGEDAMIGDRGGLRNTVLGAPGALFAEAQYTFSSPGPPFVVYTGFRPGTYDRRVDLAQELPGSVGGPFVGQATAVLASNGVTVGGNDLMRGGPDHDSIHGAFGDDIMNGDSGGDILFGADGSDVMWGGRGSPNAATPDDRGANESLVDYLFGGRGGDPTNDTGVITGGADIIDYLPRPVPIDPQAWHDAIAAYDDGAGGEPLRQHHQGVDWTYGGWDRDVMEANLSTNGPNPGDRLIDWTGAYNLYVHCNSAYGGSNDVRAISPQMVLFEEQTSYSLGIGSSLANVQTDGTSAYREVAVVYKPDVKSNSAQAYPTTPGHFENPTACTND